MFGGKGFCRVNFRQYGPVQAQYVNGCISGQYVYTAIILDEFKAGFAGHGRFCGKGLYREQADSGFFAVFDQCIF